MTTPYSYYDLPMGYLHSNGHKDPTRFLVGMELEIESLTEIKLPSNSPIQVVEDHSLRNGGREFLIPPSTPEKAMDYFKQIHGKWITYRKDAFSERTSIHIHVNCMMMEEETIRGFLYLYSIFEPVFFNYAGESRKYNIHCVPLGMTSMPSIYKQQLWDILCTWHKYTAFNMLPLKTLGTIEFRHLSGTNDVSYVAYWLRMINTLWMAAKQLESTSMALDLFFLKGVELDLLTPEYFSLTKDKNEFVLEQNLIDVKLAFI